MLLRQLCVSLTREQIFACKQCSRAFLHEKGLDSHTAKHGAHENATVHDYNQKENNTYLVNEGGLYVKRFQCAECGAKFVLESTLTAHRQVHADKYTCHCGVGFYKLQDLYMHNKLVHPVIHEKTPKHTESGKYICDYCNKQLSSKRSLDTHIRIHTNTKMFKCDQCTKSFVQKSALVRHLMVHSGVKNHKCSYCDRPFAIKSAVDLHERTHTGVKPYKCTICPKAFGDPSSFLRHKRIHMKEYKYLCKECPMKFTDASGLIAHRKRHEGAKLACQHCPKKFYTNKQVKTHVHKKHHERPFFSKICDKSYATRDELNQHLKTHENHKCGICIMTFCSSFKENLHLKYDHLKKKRKIYNRKQSKNVVE